MIKVQDVEFIRKKFHQDAWKIREIARKLGIHRKTVRRALRTEGIPQYRLGKGRSRPVLGPYEGVIQEWLREDEGKPRKQRHTAKRIYDRLVEEHGYGGSESGVRKVVARLRPRMEEVFIPLSAEMGAMAQVDWGAATVVLDGVERMVHLFVLRLRASGVLFSRAYLRESMECFLDGHREAFEWLEGVPRHCVYDNLKTAVLRILSGPERMETAMMSALRSHYLFDSIYCRPRKGNEKGSVENGVGYVRRNALVPVPDCRDLPELNERLRAWCDRARRRRALWAEEKAALAPLPPTAFASCLTRVVTVSSQLLVSIETNRYSVPLSHRGQKVLARVYPDRVEIADRERVLATHLRLEGKNGLQADIRHSLPVLAHKARAVSQAAALNPLPAVFREVRDHLLRTRRREGWKEMVAILLLLIEYPQDEIEKALVRAQETMLFRADTIRQFLLLNRAPPVPPPAAVPMALQGVSVPCDTPAHFDTLLLVGETR